MSQNVIQICFSIVFLTATVAFATVVGTELKKYVKANRTEDNKDDKTK